MSMKLVARAVIQMFHSQHFGFKNSAFDPFSSVVLSRTLLCSRAIIITKALEIIISDTIIKVIWDFLNSNLILAPFED